jgi:hypothetical protein
MIDLLIVGIAAGGYLYIQSLPKPAKFEVTNLTIDPPAADAGQPIKISVTVTNVGDEAGDYSTSLTIYDVVIDSMTIHLLGGESKRVEFLVTETNEGSYSAKIEKLTGTYLILGLPEEPTEPEPTEPEPTEPEPTEPEPTEPEPTEPEPTEPEPTEPTPTEPEPTEPLPITFVLSDLTVSPYEAWADEPIKISVKVSNTGAEADTGSIAFKVDGEVRETKTIQLSGGETKTLEVTVTESTQKIYYINVENLTRTFKIVPTGKHTLIINALTVIPFTINGQSASTPYVELMDVGPITITFPEKVEFERAVWTFVDWGGDGVWDLTKTIDLQERTVVIASYDLKRCCPALYVWNGNNYIYIAEVSDGTGYLGILDYFLDNGSIVFAYSDPWDYIKLNRNQMKPKDGYYDIILTQESNEIFYMDSAELVVVDHSPDVDVFSTKSTYIYNLDGMGNIYTVSKNPLPPISAINEKGEDVLPKIFKRDGIYTTGHEFQYDTLELNLGDLSDAEEIKLVVSGTIIYSSGEVQGEWAGNFLTQPGVKPFPPPYMEVKDKNGNWIPVPENRQFPLIDMGTQPFVVNLTGLFPTNDYSLRIHTFFNTRFDYIGVDTTSQQNVTIQSLTPVYADLSQVFSLEATSTGNFTRYGDVTPLVIEQDDKFVIGRQGDEINVKFPVDLPPLAENMERDYFLFASVWFKVDGLPYLPFTVSPLPFNDMSCFPYPPTESYPYEVHLSYLSEYNTRTITIP